MLKTTKGYLFRNVIFPFNFFVVGQQSSHYKYSLH